ncbi:MAG: sugar phosphate isomerase/epimerase [Planctomycetaceae bacterium]|nr:sugar phosphate isomerase/epimerase [Planctomycetaceae bacterium]
MTSRRIGRRSFLAMAAASCAAVAGSRRACAAAAPRPTIGIQTYSLRGYPVAEALRHAKDLGFTHVEVYPGMFPITDDVAAIAAQRKLADDLGLVLSAHSVNRFTKDADANRKVFAYAKALGVPTLGADPDPDSFASLDDLVKEFDIKIAIHNHGPRHRYNKVVDVLRAIEGRDLRIGALADLGHFIRSGEQPVDVIRALKGRLYGIHLKDFAEMQDKTKGVILGQGHIDVPAVFAALAQVGFPADAALSIEYEENEKNPLADIRECLRIARESAAKA